MNKRINKGLIAIIFVSLLMAVVALPDSVKQSFPDDPVSGWLKDQKITLGLDLQGGTQLDYRIDLSNANKKNEDDDPGNDVRVSDIIEGVRTTIERRVNNLGVSEPQIYTSSIAGEEHIIVELAGIKDINEAKAVVGKTIQLEFKEPKTQADPDESGTIRANAEDTLKLVQGEGADFGAIGERIKTGDGKVDYRPGKTAFETQLPDYYQEILTKLQPGQVHPGLAEGQNWIADLSGSIRQQKSFNIVQLVSKEKKERTITEHDDFLDVAKTLSERTDVEFTDRTLEDFTSAVEFDTVWATGVNDVTDVLDIDGELRVFKVTNKSGGTKEDEVKASHILLAYAGAKNAAVNVTRTKEEAKAEAERVLKLAKKDPVSFPELAKEYSNDSAGANGGDLGYFGRGKMTASFEQAAFNMKVGDISAVVETEFGYHIIQLNDKRTVDTEKKINFQRIVLNSNEENRTKLEAALARVKGYEVTKEEDEYTFNEIFYDASPDPWKSTGLDGAHFKYATVTYNQVGAPQVSIEFDSEGGLLFEELTGRLIGQRMAIFVGGELISAPNVNEKIPGGSAVITGSYNLQEALAMANDLNTGAIDAPIILSGQYTISATLGESALRISLYAGIVGLIILALFMIFYYRLFGIFADLALVIYVLILIFILKTTPVVMTLAGIAGIILSIGMAVDANILIFERTKEELNEGKNFSASLTTGFDRAWSSIRDSNVSSLITCSILWFFGNSIIRGFALMLALGILVSMFTAITITRTFLHTLTGTGLSKNRWLLGVKKILLKNDAENA